MPDAIEVELGKLWRVPIWKWRHIKLCKNLKCHSRFYARGFYKRRLFDLTKVR